VTHSGETEYLFCREGRKEREEKHYLVGRDKALPFPTVVDARITCNVPYAGLRLFNINIICFFCALCVFRG
jgi:hypothetical protein